MEKSLPEGQRLFLAKKLQQLQADFPIVALKILLADDTVIDRGVWPAPVAKPVSKEKRTRYMPEGYIFGTLTRVATPWLELAVQAPRETLRIRLDDLGQEATGLSLRRFASVMLALSNKFYGRQALTTRVMREANGEEVCLITFLGVQEEIKQQVTSSTGVGNPLPGNQQDYTQLKLPVIK